VCRLPLLSTEVLPGVVTPGFVNGNEMEALPVKKMDAAFRIKLLLTPEEPAGTGSSSSAASEATTSCDDVVEPSKLASSLESKSCANVDADGNPLDPDIVVE